MCAQVQLHPFTPEIARKHGLKSSHREYELFLFALPPTLHWVFLIRGVSLVVNGSGERERDAGGAPPAALQARARFYWQLVISKPICGRHGARGHSRRHKCPLWMSSTQVGKLETNWAEGAVAGGLWAASAAANATLWALLAIGIGAQIFCCKPQAA